MQAIPKVFHTVWLQPGPISPSRLQRLQTWIEGHEGWEHQHWTTERLMSEGIRLGLENYFIPEDASVLPSLAVLSRYGGVCVSYDLECLDNIEPLLEDLEVFFALDARGNMTTQIMGGVPNHPLLAQMAKGAGPEENRSRDHPFLMADRVKQFIGENNTAHQIEDAADGSVAGQLFLDTVCLFSAWIFYGDPESDSQKSSFSNYHWSEPWQERLGRPEPTTLCSAGTDQEAPECRISIVIPTINRAELLREAIEALEPQLDMVAKIYIIDNGHQNLKFSNENIILLPQEKNLGVAASWNLGIRLGLQDPLVSHILVLNDDIVLGPGQLRTMLQIVKNHPTKWMFVGTYYWSVWILSRQGANAMEVKPGQFFDEQFFPAYYEDNDFYYRFLWLYPERYLGEISEFVPNVQRNSMSVAKDPNLNWDFNSNGNYYSRKWGGRPSQERFLVGSRKLNEPTGK